ncbi:hypothetical protein G6F35_004841 [Rhizopus arrhizus]|nr:hypothetical protein G6F35_004841 [Rhizopus arrhizus]
MTSSILPFVVKHILEAKKQKDNDTSTIQTLNENIKTLLTLSSSVQEDQKCSVLCIILPTLTILLDDPPYTGLESPVHHATLAHLLSTATNMPTVFRETVLKIPHHIRTKLESAMRYSILESHKQQQQRLQEEQQRKAAFEDQKQPTIALKMDFSNFG